MKHGFIKTTALTPKIKVADPDYNACRICEKIEEAEAAGAKIIVLPEMCITGYTCGELFEQEALLAQAENSLCFIADRTKETDALIFVGLPIERDNKLYNAAAVLHRGQILAFIPKSFIPNYNEFYEARYFAPGNAQVCDIIFHGAAVPFGTNILFECEAVRGMKIACEICEDVWAVNPPSTRHALAGANIIVNLSASNATISKDDYRRELVKSASARLVAGYVYASAGDGESTQDLVYDGHNIIAENGVVLAEAQRYSGKTTYADIDVHLLRAQRRQMNTFGQDDDSDYLVIPVALQRIETRLERIFRPFPFVPSDREQREKRCEDILNIQTYGLKKRLEHVGCSKAVIGVSGGLDSTLALLASVRAFDLMKVGRENILAVTMPCFGTTGRTYDNACKLAGLLGVTLREINIREAVAVHFADIGQSPENHDVTYENSQARERMQILMDIANQMNGLVVGTGDMSELALGWTTYNGDHMSMYGVNAGVPKTLVRHLVRYYADTCENRELKEILEDVLDTPVSPELLPPLDGAIVQKTEDLVGPYDLHDFFLYYMIRQGFEPDKIFRLAQEAFKELYEGEDIKKWLKIFYKRFFSQQFKRSCLPDGPKVGSVSVSPRGDWRMPSDASAALWLKQIDRI